MRAEEEPRCEGPRPELWVGLRSSTPCVSRPSSEAESGRPGRGADGLDLGAGWRRRQRDEERGSAVRFPASGGPARPTFGDSLERQTGCRGVVLGLRFTTAKAGGKCSRGGGGGDYGWNPSCPAGLCRLPPRLSPRDVLRPWQRAAGHARKASAPGRSCPSQGPSFLWGRGAGRIDTSHYQSPMATNTQDPNSERTSSVSPFVQSRPDKQVGHGLLMDPTKSSTSGTTNLLTATFPRGAQGSAMDPGFLGYVQGARNQTLPQV